MALDSGILLRIRVLIPDNEPIYGEFGGEHLFTDTELEAYYLEGFENTKCAAGLAKQAVGASEALTLRVIKNYETSTNGAVLLKEWVAAGEALYERGLAELSAADDDEGIFEVVYPYDQDTRGIEGGGYWRVQLGGWA